MIFSLLIKKLLALIELGIELCFLSMRILLFWIGESLNLIKNKVKLEVNIALKNNKI